MKKIIYLLVGVLLTLSACTQKGYEIQGTVEGASDGELIYLKENTGQDLTTIKSVAVKNGKFSFKGEQDTAVVRILTYDNGVDERIVEVFLENGTIHVNMGEKLNEVTGTPLNDIYQGLREKAEKFRELVMNLQLGAFSEEDQEALFKDAMEKEDDLIASSHEMMTDNISNIIGVFLLGQFYTTLESAEVDSLLGQVPAEYQNDPMIVAVKQYQQRAHSSAIGQKFTDFEMKTPDGKTIKLSDYAGKGKYVLVDFWASWCGPCIREMPTIVNIYKTYKSKGLEIVGVSLDRVEADWKEALKVHNMTWPQMSDLKYWQSEAVSLYNIQGIPHVMLLDPEGTIIARGLYGDELKKKIAEILD